MLAELRLERQTIKSFFFKEQDDNNKCIVTEIERKACNNRNSVLGQKISILSENIKN